MTLMAAVRANLCAWAELALNSHRIRLTALALRSFFMNPDMMEVASAVEDFGDGEPRPGEGCRAGQPVEPERARKRHGIENSTFGSARGFWAAALEEKSCGS